MKLAFIGSMNDEILQLTELAMDLTDCLVVHYKSS